MTYATAKTTITTREYLQRLAEKGYTVISPDVMTIQDVLMIYEKLDSLRDSLRDANEGAKLMYNVAMKGEQSVLSRLDGGADVRDAINWQDEPNKLTAREIALPNGVLRSYASYNNTGKAQPLSAEAVDGERLGE